MLATCRCRLEKRRGRRRKSRLPHHWLPPVAGDVILRCPDAYAQAQAGRQRQRRRRAGDDQRAGGGWSGRRRSGAYRLCRDVSAGSTSREAGGAVQHCAAVDRVRRRAGRAGSRLLLGAYHHHQPLLALLAPAHLLSPPHPTHRCISSPLSHLLPAGARGCSTTSRQ